VSVTEEAERYAADLDPGREAAHVRQVIATWPKRPCASFLRLPEVRNVVDILEGRTPS